MVRHARGPVGRKDMPCQITIREYGAVIFPCIAVIALVLASFRVPTAIVALAFAVHVVQAVNVYNFTWPHEKRPRNSKWVFHGNKRAKPRRSATISER